MDKELMMKILIEDRNTESEAKKRIKNDTAIIYTDFEDYIDGLKACDCYSGETAEDAKAGKLRDISYQNYEGIAYFIVYIN